MHESQSTDLIVARLENARQSLAFIETPSGLKKLSDLAESAEAYARRQKLGDEVIGYAHRIKTLALRKLGEVLKAAPKAKGRLKRGPAVPDENHGDAPTLADLGIDKKTSMVAQKLAKLPEEIVEKIATRKTTVEQACRQAKEAAREQRRAENRELIEKAPEVVISAAKFATIVIDPPWDWGDEGDADQFGRARPTYGTMNFEQLMELPVGDLADVDCHLYLWITNRSLPKGFSLMERWGFRYVTALTWCKPSIGMGNYFRGSTEHVLFGVKGSQMLKRRDVGTWFSAARGPNGHSSKPTEFYPLVESCSPGPYIEMFARSKREGWSSWGAEANAA